MIIETLKVSKNVITMDRATEEKTEIAQHMAKSVINVVVKTTSGLCASLMTVNLSHSMTQEGQM